MSIIIIFLSLFIVMFLAFYAVSLIAKHERDKDIKK